ncbi:DUF6528 family protein [Chitinophaga tropicalis]|uniref:Uncharacterized protein n=1 Tax=Chitinophaga tropicalis TaxID=2683588 RepID=A0A7K1U852_9BACT|nr:DUF6528 family protein [Chitinophaga tropicalis]MVT10541.1 hypothetical protein [Chitinophaga tropicalis]
MKTKHIKKICLVQVFIACCLIACSRDETPVRRLPAEDTTAKTEESYHWIAATNQAVSRIEVYDPVNFANWNTAGALKWSWAPNASNGFTNPTAGWGLPSDVKLRNSTFFGGQMMIVADSRGFCAIIPYPAGNTKKWAINLGLISPNPNAHAIELLPDGNVAIAASAGDWVRVYKSSKGVYNSEYFQFTLDDAHGVLWDPASNLLWVLGATHLKALAVLSSPDSLKEVHSYSLPTNGGHDLSPYYYNTNLLWVSTGSKVYTFNKTTGEFILAPGSANGVGVKAISNQPAGQIIETRPSTNSCSNTWSTTTVSMYDGISGSLVATRTVNGACFYKARVWLPYYQ